MSDANWNPDAISEWMDGMEVCKNCRFAEYEVNGVLTCWKKPGITIDYGHCKAFERRELTESEIMLRKLFQREMATHA
jgi:hypothetical protein